MSASETKHVIETRTGAGWFFERTVTTTDKVYGEVKDKDGNPKRSTYPDREVVTTDKGGLSGFTPTKADAEKELDEAIGKVREKIKVG